jgi:hypothetical protein
MDWSAVSKLSRAKARQDVASDGCQHLIGACNHSGWQVLQQFEDGCSIAQAATGQFPHNERVHHDSGSLQQVDEPGISPAQVIDPD